MISSVVIMLDRKEFSPSSDYVLQYGHYVAVPVDEYISEDVLN